MSGWSGVLKEIQETQTQIDYVRRKYVKQLSDLRQHRIYRKNIGFKRKTPDK